jgi:hypothetical protein
MCLFTLITLPTAGNHSQENPVIPYILSNCHANPVPAKLFPADCHEKTNDSSAVSATDMKYKKLSVCQEPGKLQLEAYNSFPSMYVATEVSKS